MTEGAATGLLPMSQGKQSPLFRLGVSVLLMYLCGIAMFLWSINFRCRLNDIKGSSERQPTELSYLSWHVEKRGRYVVVLNYVRQELTPKPHGTVTFAVAVTFPELSQVRDICKRWSGPMSVAVYAPGSDFKASLREIYLMRLERNEPCVRSNVTWHMYYEQELGPTFREIRPPEIEAEVYRTEDRQVSWSSPLKTSSFRAHVRLPFPANIGRNVARSEARTTFILTAEPWLYPSVGVSKYFFDLPNVSDPREKSVYVLPVFKSSTKSLPDTKAELMGLSSKGEVTIPVGTGDCPNCFAFPKAEGWMETGAQNGTISIYNIVRRNKDLESWQPYFISTKDVPEYDEDMTKEGRHDRMSQVLELCLQQYNFYILDNAFLMQQPQEENVIDENVLRVLIQRNKNANLKASESLTCRYGVAMEC